MPKALRRSALPVLALVVVAAGSRAVLAAPAPAEPAPAVRPAATPVSTGDRAVFVPVTQKRLLNTTTGSRITGLTARAVKVTGVGGVPPEATAVVLNVAAYKPAKAGFLSVYPTGTTRPAGIATTSFVVGQVTENVATVRVGTGGQVNVFASTTSHAIVDLAGYYVSHAHDDRYLQKAQAQARTADNAFLCPAGTLIRAVAADGAPTCVVDASGPVSDVGVGLMLNNGVLSAAQSRGAANAFTCGLGQYLQAVAADGAPTCAADKDTDTDTDTDTQYEAGPGLTLDGTTFVADQRRDAKEAFTCPPGMYLRVVDADGTPTCDEDVDTDTDTDTTYTAGFGLLLNGTTFSAQQGRSAVNAFTCPVGQYLRAASADGTPTCAADLDTTYTAGAGITISGGTISAHQSRSAADAFSCPAGQYLRQVAADGTPLCGTDANTTYTAAGPGLTLTDTTFSLAEGSSIIRVRGDSADAATNGTRLRSALGALPFTPTATRPVVIVLSPGTYDVGTSNLMLPQHLSLVGSGRAATLVTGAFGAGSAGLIDMRNGSALASLSVTNTAASGAAVAAVVASSGTARVYDVAGTATATSIASSAYGLVVFSGGTALVERSAFTVSGAATAYGLYVVASTLRATGVEAAATSVGSSAAYGIAAGSGSTAELAGGSVQATSSSGTAYGAAELGASDNVRLAHTKLVGTLMGTPTCVGAYDAAFAPRSC